MPDQRRINPRLADSVTDTELQPPFVPELSPVTAPGVQTLMTRPWLDWARRLTQIVGSLASGGSGGARIGNPPWTAITPER